MVSHNRKSFAARKNLNLSHQVLENILSAEHLAKIEPLLEEFGDRYSQLPEWQKRHIMRECGGQKGSTVYAVLDELWRRSGGKGYAWPSVAYIANALCVHRSTVQRALNRLEALGLIVIDPNNLVYVLVISKRAFLDRKSGNNKDFQRNNSDPPRTSGSRASGSGDLQKPRFSNSGDIPQKNRSPKNRLPSIPPDVPPDISPQQPTIQQPTKQPEIFPQVTPDEINRMLSASEPDYQDDSLETILGDFAPSQPVVNQLLNHPGSSRDSGAGITEGVVASEYVGGLVAGLRAKMCRTERDWKQEKQAERRMVAMRGQCEAENERERKADEERDLMAQGLELARNKPTPQPAPQKSGSAHPCTPTGAPVRTEEIRGSKSRKTTQKPTVTVMETVLGGAPSKGIHDGFQNDGRRSYFESGFLRVKLTEARHTRAVAMAGLISRVSDGLDPFKDRTLVNSIAWLVACDVLTTSDTFQALRAAQAKRESDSGGIRNFGGYVFRMVCQMVDRALGYPLAGKQLIAEHASNLPDVSDTVFRS